MPAPFEGGGGVCELTDRQGCAILALEVVPKNLFYRILCLLFQQGRLCLTNISSKMASSLWKVANIN